MKVLVIEDEKEIRDFLKKNLEAECFAIDVAEDGERGSFLARTNTYDLIILDNVLPQKTGLQVCKEIRDHGKIMPIIMLSVKSEVSTKVDLLNAGCDDYLVKPFSFEELLARARALLRRPNSLESDVLEINGLVLDSKKHTVYKGSDQIHLTRKEFMLLEYLMRNRGTVLTRGMILEHIWDINMDPFSNTIESHIASLRRKIDSLNKKLIQTVPGLGYKIEN